MKNSFILLLFIGLASLQAQDTFSIVAVDIETGEVGSAGASCVDLFAFNIDDGSFIGQLFPGEGAVNCQAYYLPQNQENAAIQMNNGLSPDELINWLIENDVENNPNLRQYGVARIVNGNAQSASYTGIETDDYKGHRVGDNYAIQGNILLNSTVLDQMESNFLNTTGSLSEKLMAAMQGANIIGADARCADNESSSLFSYIKVAQPNDDVANPYLKLSVRTNDGDQIEPIDSLQTLFDEWTAENMLTNIMSVSLEDLSFYPNPVKDVLHITLPEQNKNWYSVNILTTKGELVLALENKGFSDSSEGNTSNRQIKIPFDLLDSGVYYCAIQFDNQVVVNIKVFKL